MGLSWIPRINNAMKRSFYFLFFAVPLAMWPDTYELFEFNKMWVVFGVSLFIFFLWVSKMVLEGRVEIRRTPLDAPLALFLVSQIISTIFSIDPHTSIWGYYSRFNGGLLSIISYIFLYYAFVTNLIPKNENEKPISYKLLVISLFSGFAVTLWGLPSHFGIDFTCFVFRGSFDVSCWTEAFQPTIRIFSTLGQPNWLGTYLAALIPVALGFGIYKLSDKNKLLTISYLLLTFLFYVGLLWTRSQSSFLGLGVGLALFIFLYLFIKVKEEKISDLIKLKTTRFIFLTILVFAVTTFFVGSPIPTLNRYITKDGLLKILAPKSQTTQQKQPQAKSEQAVPQIEYGGTESSKIRLIVWRGAIELFKRNPLFGTGVETYAYAYYSVKPLEHNLTSEWDYLYNKAHNEYLNYLATTGAFGLGSHLLIILFFFYKALKILRKEQSGYFPISTAILGSYAAIITSNFFGFSVVIVNLLFFFLPIFFFELESPKVFSSSIAWPKNAKTQDRVTILGMAGIAVVAFVVLFYEFYLLNFWLADRKYALGYNLNKAGEFTQAFRPLSEATKMAPGEDLYQDELSINMATLAILLADQKQATQAAQFATEAKRLSDDVVSRHPHNVIFWKTRTRVAFALSQIDPKLIDLALDAIKSAEMLAPTDAKIVYNMALFYNQKGDNKKAEQNFREAIRLKPNYIDAYYALGLLYSQLAKDDAARAAEYRSKARELLEFVLRNIDPNNKAVKDLLETL